MIGLYTLVGVAVLLLAPIASHATSDEDWATRCDPQRCRCKWASSKKTAECTHSNYRTVPKNLSDTVQVLDMSHNMVEELAKDAFKSENLINLQKLYARSCHIERVDKDAFRGLVLIIELDLSDNKIHLLHSTTFHDPYRLRIINLNHNKIETLQNGLFSDMVFLQSVQFNECRISQIEPKTFHNLTKFNSLELRGNLLVNVKSEILDSIPNLVNLDITGNPWRCDCKLRPFRDLVTKLNLKTASCLKPARLANKMWIDIEPDEFACQPNILFPSQNSTFEFDDEQLTIGCKIYGEPVPSVQWVFNSRPISNYSHSDFKFTVYENVDNSMAKWINLTISRSRLVGKSEFKCIAENPAGLDERKITVNAQNTDGKGILGTTVTVQESLPIIIGLVAGIFIIILLLIVCCLCCFRRHPLNVQSKKSHTNGFSNGDVPNHHNHVTSLVSEPSEQQKSLLAVVNPVQKPPRRYESSSPTGTEMTELKRNLLDETSISGDADEHCFGDSGDELASLDGGGSVNGGHLKHIRSAHRKGTHPPDLLAFPRGGHGSPVGSVASSCVTPAPSAAGFQSPPLHSPVYSSGTLPYNRSQSPFNSRPAQPASGYVTIPRRPRAPSWAAGATSTPTSAAVSPDDPLNLSRLLLLQCEPVYDNLGPRTTADGSSVLSLTAAVQADATKAAQRPRPAPQYSQTLPHRAKLLHQGGGGGTPVPQPRPSVSPASPDRPASAAHNALPPNYSPLVEMDARNRSSWAPSRAGTPESGVLKPALQTAGGRRKVPPKPPPKPKMKGGPLFEDEGEDGTEV